MVRSIQLTYYNGTTTLEISIKAPKADEKKILCAVLADLHYGFLAVGGLTSIGRGLFEITKANENEVSGDIYEFLVKEVCSK